MSESSDEIMRGYRACAMKGGYFRLDALSVVNQETNYSTLHCRDCGVGDDFELDETNPLISQPRKGVPYQCEVCEKELHAAGIVE